MLKFIFSVIIVVILTGCGHNINVQGFGIACPYGAMGYGTFSCVKDNVTVKSTEKATADGIETVNEFTVGRQTTGYDVELAKIK
jgi:hypothetical protein